MTLDREEEAAAYNAPGDRPVPRAHGHCMQQICVLAESIRVLAEVGRSIAIPACPIALGRPYFHASAPECTPLERLRLLFGLDLPPVRGLSRGRTIYAGTPT
ncbi:hypothetical protein KM043_003308 [Ampulex compressa]|nr:hypothetical protein KM043_003308 [Ampulex compressa]